MLKYANVKLLTPDASTRKQLAYWLKPADIWHFVRRHWPGFGMDNLPFQSAPEISFELNRLYWPTGAARWGIFWGLVDRPRLEEIRAAVFPTASYQSAELSITADSPSATGSGIATQMWMLPARPIHEIGPLRRREMSLITLVDERFFWWNVASAITVSGGSTTWAQLYASIGSALGVSIQVDSVPDAYLKPSEELASDYGRLPTLLDATAYSVGQRIVRQFDGTVRAWNVTDSDQSLIDQLGQSSGLKQLAGGLMDLKTPRDDLPSLLPASVTVVFPRTDDDVPVTTSHVETVTLVSLSLPGFDGLEGQPGRSKVFHTSALATYESSSQTNDTETEALAEQIATDWYRYQQARLDAVFDGIKDWTLTGLDDCLEARHQIEGISTHVRRGPWNDTIDGIFVRSTAGESGSGGGDGGNSIIVADDEGEDVVNPCQILLVDNSSFDVTESAEETALVEARFASVGDIQPVGAAASAGTLFTFARADHVHAMDQDLVYIVVEDDDQDVTVDPCYTVQFENDSFSVTDLTMGVAYIAPRFGGDSDIQSVGVSNSGGTSPLFARADHVHEGGSGTDIYIDVVSGGGDPGVVTPVDTLAFDDEFFDIENPGGGSTAAVIWRQTNEQDTFTSPIALGTDTTVVDITLTVDGRYLCWYSLSVERSSGSTASLITSKLTHEGAEQSGASRTAEIGGTSPTDVVLAGQLAIEAEAGDVIAVKVTRSGSDDINATEGSLNILKIANYTAPP